jgi:iron-sulfur cluster assembly accessory protein
VWTTMAATCPSRYQSVLQRYVLASIMREVRSTKTCLQRLKQITSSPPRKNTLTSSSSSPDSHLRVTVTSGGCHGFQYLMSLEDGSKIDQEEDTVFAVEPSEATGDKGKAEVVMDLPSLELLKGSTVDFTTELIGSQFKIVGNPRAKSSCGCGTSFDIE